MAKPILTRVALTMCALFMELGATHAASEVVIQPLSSPEDTPSGPAVMLPPLVKDPSSREQEASSGVMDHEAPPPPSECSPTPEDHLFLCACPTAEELTQSTSYS